MRPRAAVPDALAALPLVHGLGSESGPFTVARDVPARVARALAEGADQTRVGLITPIDYARHAGSYRIVPGIAVSTRSATGTARVRIRREARSIATLAVDPRVTSETVLAAILVAEKFSASSEAERRLPTIVPVVDPGRTELASADAILEYHPWPQHPGHVDDFSLDLYEEWADLTDLPWVGGLWVVREEDAEAAWVDVLSGARDRGREVVEQAAREAALERRLDPDHAADVAQAFSYDLGEEQEDALMEFFQYAFYLGILKDVPDLKFVDPSERDE